MKIISNFTRGAFDEEFRENVRGLLEEAEEEIIIVTGEGGSYQYQDLRWALERAADRGVSIKIYCVHPPQTYLNKNLQLTSEIYRGDRDPEDHYLIVDGKHTVISTVRAGEETGERRGEVRREDKRFAEEKVQLFDNLASAAEKVNEMEIEKDPLRQLVENPLDFGYDTHSEKFEEEL
ncbi:hypothetical protein AKJ39_04685 [candidate division MSBL1 archaeon SCGC-AAA259J03]|uniref:Transcription regulator TrmB C-terminal domain-containing protein n=1 Tax=candidate division MSBL1 archaeon SCGC-AAA259J03 TaxID=1698269 RepID=A0A656YUV7_9EURY|nr:hypothetical protein AKJ39_04685 [candidate division MSBL1 archaeon SCGC-AAA259J03]